MNGNLRLKSISNLLPTWTSLGLLQKNNHGEKKKEMVKKKKKEKL